MKLYNIDFFDRNLKCTFHTEANISKLEVDYLAPEKTSIEILKTDKINIQDIVYIREFPEYLGIVDSVTQKDYTTTVLIKPFVTVFDQPIMFDTSKQKGEIEMRMGWNEFTWGSVSWDNNLTFSIYLKPENYKFGLFNAGPPHQFGFNEIENITSYKDDEDHDKVHFIAKCGHSMYDRDRNVVYGPRVCVDGTVSQPVVPVGAFLYYMIDSNGKTSYGDWSTSMVKGETVQDGETISGDEWYRKNVQMLCSPDFIYIADGDRYRAYSAHRPQSVMETDVAHWSFFGKDRHGRFFLGVCHSYTTAQNIWDILFKSCGITELAFIGGGKVEDDINTSTFKDAENTDHIMGWISLSYSNDMGSQGGTSSPKIGDTFAFYEELSEKEEDNKKPWIRGNYETVQLNPDVSLEDQIITYIKTNWINPAEGGGASADDAMMYLPIVCNMHHEDYISQTKKWTLSIKPDNQNSDGTIFPGCVVNFYSTIIQQAFRIYRIAMTAEMVWNTDTTWSQSGKNIINIKIGVPQGAVHIEADLPNVKIKELIDGKANSDVNKLIVYNLDHNSLLPGATYYRYKNSVVTDYRGDSVAYGQTNTDRIYPVVQEIAIVDSTTKDGDNQKDFTTLAWEQAASVFGDIKWKNYIELEIYNPPKIQLGQLCYIHHDGKIYETVLTGIKDGETKTLIFGAYREDYTKSMIVNNYNRILEIKKASKNSYTARSTNLGKDY